MPYNFDRLPSRRAPGILNKWTLYSNDILPMWLADADFPVAPEIQRALQQQVAHGVLGYELLNRALFATVAGGLKRLYNWEVDPEWLVYTVGVNQGCTIAIRTLCSGQRGYLIQTPVYNEFHDMERFTGFRKREARLRMSVLGNRISYEVDYEAFEKGIRKSNMFLLCHPHNPVGRIFSQPELKRMAEICIDNDVTMVSDEIHGGLLLGDTGFTPLATLSQEIEKRTITLISASKAYNVPGLACAFAIIPDRELRRKFKSIAYGQLVEVSTPGLAAARIAYSGKADAWLKALRRYLTANRDFALDFIEETMPGIRTTKPDATYLLWLDCTELNLKPSPYEFFLKHAKVALSEGARFGRGSEQFVRLNFGTSRRILANALKRMRDSLK